MMDSCTFAEAVACNLKLPSIMLRTSSATNLLSYYAYPRLQEEGYIPFQDSMNLELVPGLHPLRFKDLSISNMDCLEQSSLAQLQQQCEVPVFLIGPMHKIAPASSSSLLEEDTSCMTWLDKQTHNSVIYVSLGSVVSVDEKELTEMAWGLANSKQPFLWVLRPDLVHGSESSDLFPYGFKETVGDRGCIVKWASSKKSEGVPMICRPSFGDQGINTRYVSHVWKVGLELENGLERGEIERTIKRLMVGKEGEEMRRKALDFKAKAQLCIREGGSSYNSLNELTKAHLLSLILSNYSLAFQ
ncbi:hypothetical protein Patl1_31212 [Pistacia atlantica]|uniref:Uncharacterized protein n=1 Tax=Pistacia atlantica TaxID=434234 RepID=A0ACC1A8L2_9ROSI|nr:hypothetical protein Patl1_31212 [Pistacia atlantica]